MPPKPTATSSPPPRAGGAPVPPSGGAKTLADVLVAEDQEHVPSDVIVAVLRSITLTDDIMASGSDIPARPVPRRRLRLRRRARGRRHAPQQAAPSSPPRPSSATASTSVPVPRAAPEYIGATNRAARRRERLAEHDQLITQADNERRETQTDRTEQQALLDDFRRARRELPDTAAIAKAAERAGRSAALLAHARTEVESDQDRWTRPSPRPTPRPASSATRPPSAVCRPERTRSTPSPGPPPSSRTRPWTCTRSAPPWPGLRRTSPSARNSWKASAGNKAEDEAAEAERLQEALAEEFRTLEEALQQDVKHVLEQIRQTDRDLKQAQQQHDGQAGRAWSTTR